jgi:RNA polymerase sigma-70 factor (ECF subfamily)
MTTLEFNQELTNVKSTLFSFALKLTKDYQDAQDLFQDAAARGFRYCNRFEMGTNFRAWMATIIRNTFINKCRANQKRRTVSEPIETFTYSIENQNIVANQGEMDMRIQEIYRMLENISEIYRIPFMMHYQGFEYKDIAEQLDLPIGTIKSRLHTARTMLKKMIVEKDSLPQVG